jgi:hypothetical protein
MFQSLKAKTSESPALLSQGDKVASEAFMERATSRFDGFGRVGI